MVYIFYKMICIHSENGFVSTAWGPVLWFFLHSRAGDIRTDLVALQEWFLLLGEVLPCKACRENFVRNLRSSGFDVHKSFYCTHSATLFLTTFHNIVNTCLGKPAWSQQPRVVYPPSTMFEVVIATTSSRVLDTTLHYHMTGAQDPLIHLWWFLVYVVVLNCPSTTAYTDQFLSLCIRLLNVQQQRMMGIWDMLGRAPLDRDAYMQHILRLFCLFYQQPPHSTLRCFQQMEYIRATSCTTSTPTSEGTCGARSLFRTSIVPRTAPAVLSFPFLLVHISPAPSDGC